MFVVIWEYEVRAGSEAAFEALHCVDGDWVDLFGGHPGYRDTQLLRGEQPGHHLTIDRLGDALTLAERCVGGYHTPC